VLQGSGDPELERAFQAAARAHPRQVGVRIGYDEAFAHRLIAGSDVIMVPSRFEPCGLTQLYGLSYGTLPLVRRVGGLADTVDDASDENLRSGRATGFVFGPADAAALEAALSDAISLFRRPAQWQAVMRTAMTRDHSWAEAGARYLSLYRSLLPA
jgi:starch synthase